MQVLQYMGNLFLHVCFAYKKTTPLKQTSYLNSGWLLNCVKELALNFSKYGKSPLVTLKKKKKKKFFSLSYIFQSIFQRCDRICRLFLETTQDGELIEEETRLSPC